MNKTVKDFSGETRHALALLLLLLWQHLTHPVVHDKEDDTPGRTNFKTDFIDNGERLIAYYDERRTYGNISTRSFPRPLFGLCVPSWFLEQIVSEICPTGCLSLRVAR